MIKTRKNKFCGFGGHDFNFISGWGGGGGMGGFGIFHLSIRNRTLKGFHHNFITNYNLGFGNHWFLSGSSAR